MDDKTKMQLTAAEMSGLWAQYINDTLATCVTNYFIAKVEDEEVRPVLEFTNETARENISIMEGIFNKDEFPIPIGFTENDVNPKAPKLFSDTFVLMFLRHMSIMAMAASSSSLGLATRPDLVDFHKRILKAGVKLQDQTRELMLKQGTYVKSPYISIPDRAEFVEKQHFLAGFFGKQRSLTSLEVTHLFFNIQTNAIGKALITGYAQTAESEEVKQFLLRGMRISQDHIFIFSEYLKKNDLPAPMSWDSAVSDSTAQVFSDKLIMFNVLAMITAGIGYYGMSMAASPRRDIGIKYASLIPEISLYAEAGTKIMIKHGWMEEPPLANDRSQLI